MTERGTFATEDDVDGSVLVVLLEHGQNRVQGVHVEYLDVIHFQHLVTWLQRVQTVTRVAVSGFRHVVYSKKTLETSI